MYEAVYPDMIAFLKDNAGIELTDEEERIVHEAAKLAGRMDIDEAEDIEAERDTIAAEVGVEVEEMRDLMAPLRTSMPSPTTAGRSRTCSGTVSFRRTSGQAIWHGWSCADEATGRRRRRRRAA